MSLLNYTNHKKRFKYGFPIRPLSIIELILPFNHRSKNMLNKKLRVGFYSRQDGLDVIWLVNKFGIYQESIDHAFLMKYFRIISESDIYDYHGAYQPVIKHIDKATDEWL